MSNTIEITIAADLPEGLLAQKARDLGAALVRAGVPAHAPAAKALLETLKGLLLRDKTITIELTRADGTKIKLDAKNIASAEAAGFVGLARDALG